jgi:hypothetical protein
MSSSGFTGGGMEQRKQTACPRNGWAANQPSGKFQLPKTAKYSVHPNKYDY